MKAKEKAASIISFLAICLLTLLISFSKGAWTYYPGGGDAPGHLSKAQYVLEYWPNSDWGYIWYGGTAIFRWYGPIYEYLTAACARATGTSVAFSLILIFVVGIALAGLAVYQCTLSLIDNRYLSLIAAFLTVSSPALWGWGLIGGMYPKVLAVAFFAVCIWLLSSFIKRTVEDRFESKWLFLTLIIMLSLVIASHPYVGFASVLATLITIVVCVPKWRRKIIMSARILAPALFLSAWFWIPFISVIPKGVSIPFSRDWSWTRIFEDTPFFFYEVISFFMGTQIGTANPWWPYSGLSPLLLILIAVSIFLLLYLKRRSQVSPLEGGKRYHLAFGLESLFFVFFFRLMGDYVFLLLSVIFLPVLCALLLKSLFSKISSRYHLSKRVIQVLLLIAILLLTFTYPAPRFSSEVSEMQYPFEERVRRLLANDTLETNYRIAIPDDTIAGWLNYRYAVPQTRGYYGFAMLDGDWMAWSWDGIWGKPNAPSEWANYIADWFAVKWILTYGQYSPSRYLFTDYYEEIVKDFGFLYVNATPIVSATNAPSILLVGNEKTFALCRESIFRCLSYTDFDSRYVIPVRGPHEYVDEYTAEELRNFDAIILYGYEFHDREKAYELLREYVEAGGGLILETGLSLEPTASNIPLPSPTSRTKATDFGTSWHFTYENHPVTNGIDFDQCSPALYGNFPWGLSASFNESLKPWARTVLWDQGHPVVIVGEYGKGRVVWSGLNLPTHIELYKNPVESRFLSNMIDWVSDATRKRAEEADYAMERVNPHRVDIVVNRPSSGVLYKEFYLGNWHAYLEAAGRRSELDIYKTGPMTGPGLMYIRIPSGSTYPVKVVFRYEMTQIEWGSSAISIATLCILLIYGLEGVFIPPVLSKVYGPFLKIWRKLKKRVTKLKGRVTDWWRGEE